jgi:probable HAF family extracellular repeat protein
MKLFHSLRRKARRSPDHRGGARRAAGRPSLEALEDRCVPSYTLTPLGTLGGGLSSAYAINASGLVVGQADVTDGTSHAFRTDGGPLQDLGTLGGDNSAARALNSLGTVIGWANDTADPTHQVAFLSDSQGMRSLGLDGVAYGINDAGRVVGQTADGQAFVTDGQDPLLLPNPAGLSRASAVNGSGVVAGWDQTDLPFGPWTYRRGDAWIWDNGTKTDLGVIPFPGPPQHSEAYAINDHGQVVGRSGEYAYQGDTVGWVVSHAFLWQAGHITDLYGLPGGGTDTVAYAINNNGDVVGTSAGHAFLYHAGVMTDLNDLIPPDSAGVLVAATGINDAGQIVGYGTAGAFLLNPVNDSFGGTVSGTWSQLPTPPDVGGTLLFDGSGMVTPLGKARATGTLQTPGFILDGHAQGTFQLANAQGSVTVALVSEEPLPPFSGPPTVLDYTFHYTVVAGTGADANVRGSGEAFLHLTPEQRPDCQPGEICPQYVIAASFTLQFVPEG